jgi:protein-S-isoprenylcysteine O-methyltransferase Ste14
MYFGYIAIWIICLIRLLHYTPRTIYFIGGGIILILGVMFRFVSLYYLGRQYSGNMAIYENHKLISDGIYKYLRHPLHLALIIELAGMIIYSESWKLLFLWIILFITVLVRNKTEDEFIVKIFREKALDYQNKTSSMNIFQVFSKSKRRLKKNKKT